MSKLGKIIKSVFLFTCVLSCFSCNNNNGGGQNKPEVNPDGLPDGLDTILGDSAKEKPQSIYCMEDAYVCNGVNSSNDSVNVNYGSSKDLVIKGYSNGNTNNRIAYFKFDLSSLKSRTITAANLVLYCYSAENNEETTLNIYGASALTWDEDTITYKNKPELSDLIYTKKQAGSGYISFDLTSFLKPFIARGNNLVSVAIVNEPDKDAGEGNRRFSIRSREATSKAEQPKLDFVYGNSSFTTSLNYSKNEPNPWRYAMKEVNEYLERRKQIDNASVARTASMRAIDNAEYSLKVDAARAEKTDGDNTVYTSYPTRTLSTLKNYSYNQDEYKNYNKYGGLNDTKSFTKTGYFHVERDGERFWIVDPNGNRYFRTALNTITAGSGEIKSNLLKQYGTLNNFFKQECNHITNDLSFNAAGAWSSLDEIEKTDSNISLTGIANFASDYGKEVGLNNTTGGSTTFVNGVMPLFDPNFEKFCETKAQNTIAKEKDNPNFFGWFLDNELEASTNMLDNFTRVDYEDFTSNYSYAVAYTYLYKKLNKTIILYNDITDELRKDFRAMVYERYFYVTTNAIKKVDPNHLIIGCRFLRNCYEDEQIMKVAGYYNDIITFNYYNTWTPDSDFLCNVYKWSGKPFMTTEWYAKGMDACTKESGLTNKSGAGWSVRTQTDRGLFYQNYALRLMECPYCVGFDYFKMWDNNPADTGADSSNTNSNKGIYTIKHEEYTDMTAKMIELNKNKYSLIQFFDNRS